MKTIIKMKLINIVRFNKNNILINFYLLIIVILVFINKFDTVTAAINDSFRNHLNSNNDSFNIKKFQLNLKLISKDSVTLPSTIISSIKTTTTATTTIDMKDIPEIIEFHHLKYYSTVGDDNEMYSIHKKTNKTFYRPNQIEVEYFTKSLMTTKQHSKSTNYSHNQQKNHIIHQNQYRNNKINQQLIIHANNTEKNQKWKKRFRREKLLKNISNRLHQNDSEHLQKKPTHYHENNEKNQNLIKSLKNSHSKYTNLNYFQSINQSKHHNGNKNDYNDDIDYYIDDDSHRMNIKIKDNSSIKENNKIINISNSSVDDSNDIDIKNNIIIINNNSNNVRQYLNNMNNVTNNKIENLQFELLEKYEIKEKQKSQQQERRIERSLIWNNKNIDSNNNNNNIDIDDDDISYLNYQYQQEQQQQQQQLDIINDISIKNSKKSEISSTITTTTNNNNTTIENQKDLNINENSNWHSKELKIGNLIINNNNCSNNINSSNSSISSNTNGNSSSIIDDNLNCNNTILKHLNATVQHNNNNINNNIIFLNNSDYINLNINNSNNSIYNQSYEECIDCEDCIPCNTTYDEYMQYLYDYIYPSRSEWILIATHCVVFITGLVGNALVCIAVYTNYSMRTVTNVYIVNLAIADFFVILICLPPSVVWDVTETWFLGRSMCKIVLYFQSISVTVSVLTLTFISVDRWYAICFPLRYRTKITRAIASVAFIWIVALISDVPEFLALTIKPMNSKLRYETILFTQCQTTWDIETEKNFYIVRLVTLYLLPLLLMTIAYFKIVRVLWKSETIPGHRESRNHHQYTSCGYTRGSQMPASANTSTMGQLRARRKAAKMLVAVVIMFAVCYAPVHTFNLLRYTDTMRHTELTSVLSLLSHWLCYANSAINPIIYNFMSGKFRREFRNALEKCRCARIRVEDRSLNHSTPASRINNVSPSSRSNYQLTSVRDITRDISRQTMHTTFVENYGNGNSTAIPPLNNDKKDPIT